MHDRNGSPLKVGDIVTGTFKILEIHPVKDYCNVTVVAVRKGEAFREPSDCIVTTNSRYFVLDEHQSEPVAGGGPGTASAPLPE